MKIRKISILLITGLLLLTACGSKENEPVSAGYLPTRMESISEGGVIPEGSESETEILDGAYPMESLWGTWIPVEEPALEETFTAKSATNTDETTGEETEPISIELNVFPTELEFLPPWQSGDGLGFAINSYVPLYSYDMSEEETPEYENTLVGQAFLNQGLGQGKVIYDYIEPTDTEDALSLIFGGGEYKFAYGLSENTLALGLISSADEDAEAFDIEEINYTIDFTGWKLTLSYGDKTVTYIPKDFDQSVMIDLYENGVENNYSPAGGMLGISYREPITQVMYDLHEGYIDAEFSFTEEGTVNISAVNGNNSNLQYLVSEDTLTLVSDNGASVYSKYRFCRQSTNVEAGTGGGISLPGQSDTAIVINGEVIEVSAKTDLKVLLEAGFSTSIDTNQVLHPYIVSDEIDLQLEDTGIKVKVVNPWEKPTSVRECKICSIYIDDVIGNIKLKDQSVIGSTKYDTIEKYFEAPYEKSPELLRYKADSGGKITISALIGGSEDAEHGERLLNIDTREMELLYHFKNGVLCAYEIRCPELLFNGLQDNVSGEALVNANAATIEGIIKTRDDVLEELKKSFDKAKINVNINEATGEIALDTNVLFAYDSFELTSEGKEYINSFIKVYASVILDDSLKDIISEVRFEGHTDSNGSYDYNLELSQKRADAVLNYCLGSEADSLNGKHKERLNKIASTVGYSFADLVYDKEGNEDEAASRRVEIKFYVNTDG